MIAGACIATIATLTITDLTRRCPVGPDLERACLLAASNARVHASWLEPGHRQREGALLLLSGDAAWAPVCAKDRRAAELLRDRILTETATLNAPRASDLARELVDLLEKGQGR